MRACAAVLACLLVVACAGVEMKQGTKSHARREIPPGPGILTGPQGEFVLFRLEGDAQVEVPREEDENGEAEDPAEPHAR